MGRLSRRLRALATAGAVVAGTAGLVGAAQPASASPNQCNDPLYGVFWHSEWDMADASADWCRNWVLDPGIGKMNTRQDILNNGGLYDAWGFHQQYLWYAPEIPLSVGPGQYWSDCKDFRIGGACATNRVSTAQTTDIDYLFGGPITLTSLAWKGSFISLVCGNFSVPAGTGAIDEPVPTIRGVKFNDANRDGSQDNGEAGVAGVTFRLIRDSSAFQDQPTGFVTSTTSAADGSFSFRLDGQGPGHYTVEEETPSGWVPTTATSQGVQVDPGAGDTTYNLGFGNRAENPPVPVAPPAQKLDQSQVDGTPVTLDGSKSSDPDGDPLTYTWTTPFGTYTGVSPTIVFPPGTSPVTLTVSDGIESRSADTSVTVYPPITLQGQNVSSQEGQSFSGVVGTFTDPDPEGNAAEYAATIDWGDGTPPTAGVISKGTDGTFSVNAGHTYAEEGSYSPSVTVTDTEIPFNHATAPFTATVTDAPLAAQGKQIVSLLPVDQALATFTDQNPGAPQSDFTATIDWGDGTPPTAGVITGSQGGPFTVSGQHTYAEPGPETITINVLDEGGQTAQAVDQAIIGDQSSGGNFVIGDQNAAVGTQVTYWGAQWWKLNGLSGGTAPAAFKGFEDNPAGTTDLTAWTTDPGNSSNPPASVPTYMAVIVSSAVSQNGSVISGDAPHVVIVKTDPGYAADPGHAGTGTVVATLR